MSSPSDRPQGAPDTQASAPDPGRWNDTQVEQIIGNLLRAGVFLAATVTFIGGVLYLWRYGALHPDYRLFRGEPAELRSVGGTLRFALEGRRRGIIQVGILLLIATPIARVVFSTYAFARERDRLYVGLTLVVLAILLYSLFWGHIG